MAFNKVYWKGLRLALQQVKTYIQKWQIQLQAVLTTEQYNCVLDTLTAVISCLAILPDNTPIN